MADETTGPWAQHVEALESQAQEAARMLRDRALTMIGQMDRQLADLRARLARDAERGLEPNILTSAFQLQQTLALIGRSAHDRNRISTMIQSVERERLFRQKDLDDRQVALDRRAENLREQERLLSRRREEDRKTATPPAPSKKESEKTAKQKKVTKPRKGRRRATAG